MKLLECEATGNSTDSRTGRSDYYYYYGKCGGEMSYSMLIQVLRISAIHSKGRIGDQ